MPARLRGSAITARSPETMPPTDRDRDILSLNQAMLESVVRGDWDTYASFNPFD